MNSKEGQEGREANDEASEAGHVSEFHFPRCSDDLRGPWRGASFGPTSAHQARRISCQPFNTKTGKQRIRKQRHHGD